MTEVNLFKLASQKRFRFNTAIGSIDVEELWCIPLETLDQIAKDLHVILKEKQETSFIKRNTKVDKYCTQERFDLVMLIIDERLDVADKQKKKAENKAKLDKLGRILESKREESLQNLTEEELLAQIKELQESTN